MEIVEEKLEHPVSLYDEDARVWKLLKRDREPLKSLKIIEDTFLKFGLSRNEIRVYIHIARSGMRKAREVSDALSLHRTETYRILRGLEKRGLISSVLEKPLKFIATPFEEAFDTLIKAKKLRIQLLEKKKRDLIDIWFSIPQQKADEDTVTLVYSGNLGLGHELQMIVPAVSQLNGQAQIRVLFVGNGKAKQALKGLTEDVGLDNIEFRPPAPLCKLPNVLAAGDIHLVSQKSGTQGLLVPSKIYGVFAAGRPALFIGPSDCEIAAVVSESQAGIVVEPGDINGLVDAIKKLALDPGLRKEMGRRARQYYEEYFGRDRSVSRIVKTIELIA